MPYSTSPDVKPYHVDIPLGGYDNQSCPDTGLFDAHTYGVTAHNRDLFSAIREESICLATRRDGSVTSTVIDFDLNASQTFQSLSTHDTFIDFFGHDPVRFTFESTEQREYMDAHVQIFLESMNVEILCMQLGGHGTCGVTSKSSAVILQQNYAALHERDFLVWQNKKLLKLMIMHALDFLATGTSGTADLEKKIWDDWRYLDTYTGTSSDFKLQTVINDIRANVTFLCTTEIAPSQSKRAQGVFRKGLVRKAKKEKTRVMHEYFKTHHNGHVPLERTANDRHFTDTCYREFLNKVSIETLDKSWREYVSIIGIQDAIENTLMEEMVTIESATDFDVLHSYPHVESSYSQMHVHPHHSSTVRAPTPYMPVDAVEYVPMSAVRAASDHAAAHTPVHAAHHAAAHMPVHAADYSPSHLPIHAAHHAAAHMPVHAADYSPSHMPIHAVHHAAAHVPVHAPVHAAPHGPVHAADDGAISRDPVKWADFADEMEFPDIGYQPPPSPRNGVASSKGWSRGNSVQAVSDAGVSRFARHVNATGPKPAYTRSYSMDGGPAHSTLHQHAAPGTHPRPPPPTGPRPAYSRKTASRWTDAENTAWEAARKLERQRYASQWTDAENAAWDAAKKIERQRYWEGMTSAQKEHVRCEQNRRRAADGMRRAVARGGELADASGYDASHGKPGARRDRADTRARANAYAALPLAMPRMADHVPIL